jgi:hypothetical protein
VLRYFSALLAFPLVPVSIHLALWQEDGTLERIAPAALAPWVGAAVRPGEPLPDLFFFALEEVYTPTADFRVSSSHHLGDQAPLLEGGVHHKRKIHYRTNPSRLAFL